MSVIICTLDITGEQAELIRRTAPSHELLYGRDRAKWIDRIEEAEIVIGWSRLFEERCLGEHTRLRWVQSWSAGVDNFPLQLMEKRGIYLTTTSGIHAYPISESILAMMLALTRKLHIHLRNQAANRWVRIEPTAELHGKTVGIVGVGAIGEETARICKAFGMRVLGMRASGAPSPYVDHMVDASGLPYVLAESDVCVVTLPLTPQTRKMFGRREFAMMKPSALFINVGRGGVVDERALIEALQEGIIAGAALDVFEQEPLPEDSPLWQMEQVIITPHISGASDKYDERAFEIAMSNLQHYVETGRPAVNVVDYAKQY
jgi:phosphoglycerate dehydrogenase-like enzyme